MLWPIYPTHMNLFFQNKRSIEDKSYVSNGIHFLKKWKQQPLKMKMLCNLENASDIILNEVRQMQTIHTTTTMEKYVCKWPHANSLFQVRERELEDASSNDKQIRR